MQGSRRARLDSESFASNPDQVGAFRRSWALTRWVVMVLVIGAAIGVSIAIAITVLLNALDASL